MDSIDLQILKRLQEDARITNLQLSNEIGLSPAPTLERVRKMERSGLIKSYHAVLNEEEMGIGVQALIQVSLARKKNNEIQKFTEKILSIEEVVEVIKITGSFDFQLKIQVKNMVAFNDLISNKLGIVEEIGQMQSSVIIASVKNSKVLPINYS